MSSKTYAITLNGVEYIMTARELTEIADVVTGITPSTAEYTGEAIDVKPISEKTLVQGTDYAIAYSDNINIGTCVTTITGVGDYLGTVSYDLTITEPKIDIATVISGIIPTTAEYTGEPITVDLVTDTVLVEGTDYTISYSDNINVGTCVVTVTGMGDYKGTAAFDLEITEPIPEPVDISTVVSGISPTTAEYTGEAITVNLVTDAILVEGTDYSITYSDNINVGNCAVTVSGLGNYTGTATFTLEITEPTPVPVPVDISTVITGINPTTAEYTGEAITVAPVTEEALIENTDYSVAYSDNINVGSCTVTYTGLGEFTGTATFTLEITEAEEENTENPDQEPENDDNSDPGDADPSDNTETDDSAEENPEEEPEEEPETP